MYGVDISHWQGVNALANILKKADRKIEFALIKASEGTSYVDSRLAANVADAKRLGLHIGVYHYARPEYNSAIAEATHFLDVLNRNGVVIGEDVLVLDYEGVAHQYGEKWAREWLDQVYRETGVKPMIYLSAAYLSKYKSVAEGDYGLWVAKWGAEPTDVRPWAFKAIWQYNNVDFDKDVFYGTAETWTKYAARDYEVTNPGVVGCGCCGCCHRE